MLVNPVFSAWRRRNVPRIRGIFEQAGITVDYFETGPKAVTAEMARRAAANGTDAVMVCGGDGTVCDVLQGLAGTTVPIGILPFGTGNVLVQNLGLPRDQIRAAKALLSAAPVEVRLGRITNATDHLYFAMAAGVGGHAAMMKSAYRYWKHRTGRLAYFAAGFEVLATHPLTSFDITVETTEGQTHERTVSELIAVRVGELNIWRTGGGLHQPSLRLATVEGASRAKLFRASVESLVFGAGHSTHQSATAAARYEDAWRITIRRSPNDKAFAPLSLQADGEIVGAVAASPTVVEMAKESAWFLSAKTP
jgi:diacylglycerol kinase family enzyme